MIWYVAKKYAAAVLLCFRVGRAIEAQSGWDNKQTTTTTTVFYTFSTMSVTF